MANPSNFCQTTTSKLIQGRWVPAWMRWRQGTVQGVATPPKKNGRWMAGVPQSYFVCWFCCVFVRLMCFHRWVIPSKFHSKSHRIHGAAIYGNIYHQYTPVMLTYIPAPWILWERGPTNYREYDTHMSPKVTEHRDGDSPRHLSDLDSAGGNLGGDQDLLLYILWLFNIAMGNGP